MTIESPSQSEFEFVKKHIKLFELDNRALEINQFIIAKSEQNILGFIRMRTHSDCQELACLGVIERERGKGVSIALLTYFIQKSHMPLFLVCIIPEFFEPLGFKIVSEYPEAIQDKLNYCTNDLVVPEKYVVMKYFSK